MKFKIISAKPSCSKLWSVSDLSERQHNEEETVRKMTDETPVMGHVHVTLVDDSVKLQDAADASRSEVRHVCGVLSDSAAVGPSQEGVSIFSQ